MLRKFHVNKLHIEVHKNRDDMGKAAAVYGIAIIKHLLQEKEEINVMFAAAPSQDEVLEYLKKDKELDFSRINAYHLDEYIGLPVNAPQGFGNFLRKRIFSSVNFKSVHYINGQAADYDVSCEDYASKLAAHSLDICFIGIGENGHIAFNDPMVADFNDTKIVKVVKLDERCRQQQVNDGCFDTLAQVPTHALTVTIPTIMSANHIICTVPSTTKAEAVYHTLYDDISEACPASILRRHDNATLYLEPDSAGLLKI